MSSLLFKLTISRIRLTQPFTKKHIAPNDVPLMYIPSKNLNMWNDSNALCESQNLNNFRTVPENCQSLLLVSERFNIHKVSKNTWLLRVSVSIPATISYSKLYSKPLIYKANSIIPLYQDCSVFIEITTLQTEPRKVIHITNNSNSVLILFECCKTIPEKETYFDLKKLWDLNIHSHKLD